MDISSKTDRYIWKVIVLSCKLYQAKDMSVYGGIQLDYIHGMITYIHCYYIYRHISILHAFIYSCVGRKVVNGYDKTFPVSRVASVRGSKYTSVSGYTEKI